VDLLTTLEAKVSPANAALLTVDVQNDFGHDKGYLGRLGTPLGLIQAIAPPLKRLLAAARKRGLPVIHVVSWHDEQYASPVVTEQKLRHGSRWS
jgi:ureidoacrylate peracid hydrolase